MDELLDNEEIDVKEKILGISKLLDSPATLEIINDDVVGIKEKNAIMHRITRLIVIAEKENYTIDSDINLIIPQNALELLLIRNLINRYLAKLSLCDCIMCNTQFYV